MESKKKHERTFEPVTTLRPNDRTQEVIERQLRAFRAKFGRDPKPGDPIFFDPSADEPRALGATYIRDQFMRAARESGLLEETIRFMEQNYDNDAIFDCPRCETQHIGWALAHPVCPDCGHHPMRRGVIVAK